jgi:hypothetical protein
LHWALRLFEAIIERERVRGDQTVVRAAEDAARKVREASATATPSTTTVKVVNPPTCNYVVKARVQDAGFQMGCE